MKALKYILLSIAALSLIFACEADPNGYTVDSKSFSVEAFGPNPVVRGATLTFVGQHLDQVTSIVLPVDVEVMAADFLTHTSGIITLTVPSECEVGYVTVNYNGKSLTLSTALSFTETFEIYSVSAQDSSKELLEAGDSVVVKGEYLNNVILVGFVNGLTISSDDEPSYFGTQDRNTLVFALPAGAVSGKIYCEDSNGNQVYSDEELSVLQPVISEVSPLIVYPYETVTITGERLDQVTEVTFSGASAISAEDFLAHDYNSIQVSAPYNIADGPLTLSTESGQTVVSEAELTVVNPSNLTVEPEGEYYRGGWNLVIGGDDTWLITGVYFYDANGDQSWAACWYDEDLASVVATIPYNAVDGQVTVYMPNGTTIVVDEIALTLPQITGIEPAEVVAGENIVLVGVDLDLVTSASISGISCDVVGYGDGGASVTVQTNDLCPAGVVTVGLANGTSVTSEASVSFTYSTVTQSTSYEVEVSNETARAKKSDDSTAHAYYGEVLNIYGSGYSAIESIYIGDLKVTEYKTRSDSQLSFVIPDDVVSGTYNLTFNLSDGSVEYCPLQIAIYGQGTQIVLWTGDYGFGTGWGGFSSLSWDDSPFYENPVPYNKSAAIIIEFYMQSYAEYLLASICNPSGWGILDSCYDSEYAQGDGWSVGSSDLTKITYELRDDDIAILNDYGILVRGYNMALTKVSLRYDD